jgi:CheY-like chemotaxis protein
MTEPAGPANVLLVEDDPDIRHCLTRLLERQGYQVAAAVDGWQALEYLRRHEPPGLVLLDLVMPEMDGWEFLHARRHRRDLWDVPVVVFSAVADCKGPDPRALGAAEVLRKPVGLAEVLGAVRRYCAEKAGRNFP